MMKKKNHRHRQAAKIELLEARVLYSADIIGAFASELADPSLPDLKNPLAELPFAENKDIHALVFIGTRTPDYNYFLKQLEKDPSSHRQVVLLDHTQSGVEQISKTSRALNNVQSIHFVSHNIGTGIALGADILDENLYHRISRALPSGLRH